MICPEGYFTPATLQESFRLALANDRIIPRVCRAANANFDSIKVADRPLVREASAKLFVAIQLEKIYNRARVFCPTKNSPLKIDAWVFRSAFALPMSLPLSGSEALKTNSLFERYLPFICTEDWAIKGNATRSVTQPISNREAVCLEKINGWSVCFQDHELPSDFGSTLEGLARTMVQRQTTQKRPPKKRGPKGKVGPLTTAIRSLYPKGIQSKPAKQIQRDLISAGYTDFSETTLRSAMAAAKA